VLDIVVYRLPNDIKDLVKGDKVKSRMNRIDSSRSEDFKAF